MTRDQEGTGRPSSRRLAILSLTALGMVYGDIGTSPLYAFRACFSADVGLPRDSATVYGPSGAAALLGIAGSTLASRMKALGIRRPR